MRINKIIPFFSIIIPIFYKRSINGAIHQPLRSKHYIFCHNITKNFSLIYGLDEIQGLSALAAAPSTRWMDNRLTQKLQGETDTWFSIYFQILI